MTSEGLGEMFEGDSGDTCAEKFLLVSMGGRAEGLTYADPEARTPIRATRNCLSFDPTFENGLKPTLFLFVKLKCDF